jgi:hypothetical protein
MLRPSRACLPWVVALAFAAAGPRARAQRVIDTPDGRAEVIGLTRWTPQMLTDSLGLRAPGVSLFQTAECTKALTDRLHFPGVHIEKTVAGPPGVRALSVVIRVVEPPDSARVRWARAPRDTQPPPAAWAGLRRVFSDPRRGVFVEDLNGLALYGVYRTRGRAQALRYAAMSGADTARAVALWAALERHARPADLHLALRTLREDGGRQSRILATAVLANFPASDAAWRAVAGALRDRYPGVHVAAQHSLAVLGAGPARPVDWGPAAADLRAVLDGTNLMAFVPLVQALARTAVAPSHARALLGGGGELLVAHAEAADPRSRTAAEALLRQLHGPGAPPAGWRAWVASL